MIPESLEGYAVDVPFATVHRRYADHVAQVHRTRTVDGVRMLLKGAPPNICRRCWPNYRKPTSRPASKQKAKA